MKKRIICIMILCIIFTTTSCNQKTDIMDPYRIDEINRDIVTPSPGITEQNIENTDSTERTERMFDTNPTELAANAIIKDISATPMPADPEKEPAGKNSQENQPKEPQAAQRQQEQIQKEPTQPKADNPQNQIEENPAERPIEKPVEKPKLVDRSDLQTSALSKINELRAEAGNSPVTLNGEYNSKATSHAKKMAEQKKIFHSDFGLTESVLADLSEYSTGQTLAGVAVSHNGAFKNDKDITNIGIGIYENTENGKIYFCLVGNVTYY